MGEGEIKTIDMHHTKKLFAQELRKDSTPEEKIVWEALRNRKFKDLKFRRQHILQGFVVDFCCHELRLAIEIDGKIHQKQEEYDTLRQILIGEKGIRFIRITNKEINKNIHILFNKMEKFLPPPLPSRY
jgi:very-short-patch-repair endonuclease